MTNIFFIAIGGSLGALCRYGLSITAATLFGSRFPLGTMLANLTGCFFIGMALALADKTSAFTPTARLFFMTGFLGSLTTFSTYALETVQAIRNGSGTVAFLNLTVNNLCGLALVVAGMWVIQRLTHYH